MVDGTLCKTLDSIFKLSSINESYYNTVQMDDFFIYSVLANSIPLNCDLGKCFAGEGITLVFYA